MGKANKILRSDWVQGHSLMRFAPSAVPAWRISRAHHILSPLPNRPRQAI